MKMKKGKIMALYAFIAFLAYMAVALFEISGVYFQRDIFGGLALIVISITFLAGVKETWASNYKGLSFILGGLILSSIFGIMHVLILFANILEWLIGESHFPDIIRPEILLLIFISPLLVMAYDEIKAIK